MKVLCSQEVVSPHVCGAVPCQVTAKASAPQGPWCVLCLWLQKGLQENMVWFEHIDFYAFSRGSFRKPARNLIETAQRKSQPCNLTPKFHIPSNYVVERIPAQRKPPEVRIWTLRNQSRVGTVPPSTSTPHWPACWARR